MKICNLQSAICNSDTTAGNDPCRKVASRSPYPNLSILPFSNPPISRAYTIVEILVVVGVFSILGSILIGVLYGAIRTWRSGEQGRQAFENGQIVMTQIKEDLTSVFINSGPGPFSPGKPVEIRFLCRYAEDPDNDGVYNQELSFVRSIPQDVKNFLALAAGDLSDNDGDNAILIADGKDNDGDGWAYRNNGLNDDYEEGVDEEIDESDEDDLGTDEATEGIDEEFFNRVDDDLDGKIDEDLRAVGDLMQVRYELRGDKLCRGIQAPLGASRDPLDPNRNLETDPERFSITATPTVERLTQAQIDAGEEPSALPLVTGVLYFGIRFWSGNTTDWEEALDSGGPEDLWDSTRGLTLEARDIHVENPVSSTKQLSQKNFSLTVLDERKTDDDFPDSSKREVEFTYYKPAENVESDTLYNYLSPVFTDSSMSDTFFDPSDDVFPRRVQIILVVTNTRGRKRSARLTDDILDSTTDVINVDDTTPFRANIHSYVKIGNEWIRYSFIKGDHILVIAPNGRGARGTAPADHSGGDEVLTGTTFIMTFDLPSYRDFDD